MVKKIYTDLATPWQWGFQDSATPVMEGIMELHDRIMWYVIIIFVVVSYILLRTIMIFKKNKISNKYSNHGTLIEIVWTIIPALILISIALPSFRLLYLMDETLDTALTVKVIGKQWYWTYELADTKENVTFDSYMVPTDDLQQGDFRLLEVDNILYLPVTTNIRFLVTGADVIHSFAVPSLGIKVDAIPGRLNQVSTFIKRPGTYYGQCSELCGVQHGFMPIVIKAVSVDNYIEWENNMINENS